MLPLQTNFNCGDNRKQLSLYLDEIPVKLINPYQIDIHHDTLGFVFGLLKDVNLNREGLLTFIKNYKSEIESAGLVKVWIHIDTFGKIPTKKVITSKLIANYLDYSSLEFLSKQEIKQRRMSILGHGKIHIGWAEKQILNYNPTILERELRTHILNKLKSDNIFSIDPINNKSWCYKEKTSYQKLSLFCTSIIYGGVK